MAREYEAIALIDPADSEADQDHDREESILGRNREPSSLHLKEPSSLPTILFIATLFVSVLSLFWSISHLTSLPSNDVERDPKLFDVKGLRRPSLYMGLEKVPDPHVLGGTGHHDQPSSTFLPYTGGPQEVARMSSRYPYFPSQQNGWVLLTEDDRVMMKFDPPPRGALSCQLASYFPLRAALGSKLLTLEYDDGGKLQIQVHLHSTGTTIDFPALTWHGRPQSSTTSLKPLIAEFGVNSTTTEFPCSSDEPILVELACEGHGCRVEFEVEEEDPRLGIEIIYIHR